MNRRKLISYIIGLCGAGVVPTVVQAADPNKIDYEIIGKHDVAWRIAQNIYLVAFPGPSFTNVEYKRMINSSEYKEYERRYVIYRDMIKELGILK
jgi:hypothetical protein